MGKYQVQTDNGTFEIETDGSEKSFGASVLENAGREIQGMGQLVGQIANPIKTGMDIGRSAAQVYDENRSVMQPGRGASEVLRQGVVEPVKQVGKSLVRTFTHPVESFKESPIGTTLSVLPIGKGIGELLGKAGSAVTRKGLNVALGPSTEAISARMANPSAIKNASTFSEIADKVPQTFERLQTAISKADTTAWETLSKSNAIAEGAIPKNNISSVISSVKNNIGEQIGKSDKVAHKVLSDIENDISQLQGQAISESRIKQIIQKLDDNVDWTNSSATQSNKSLQSARTALDNMLKLKNPDYAKAMKPVNELMNLLQDSEKLFVPKKVAGQGYAITDTTVNKLQNLYKGSSKDASKSILQKLKQVTGDDYLTDTKNASYARQFEMPTTHGSRRTVLGGAIGAGVGKMTGSPTLGALAGAGAGYIADVEGGKLAGKMIDIASPIRGSVMPVLRKAGKYPVFNKGNVVVGQIIQSKDGNYQVVGDADLLKKAFGNKQ